MASGHDSGVVGAEGDRPDVRPVAGVIEASNFFRLRRFFVQVQLKFFNLEIGLNC
jgi:hypothetical protein